MRCGYLVRGLEHEIWRREGFWHVVSDFVGFFADVDVRAFKENRVQVGRPFVKKDAKGELLITIMSSLAQEESRSISENVTWGHRKRFADGKIMVPYKSLLGYKKGEDGSLVIDETQAPTVRLIYQLFLDGMAISEIKSELAARRILTPRGEEVWSTSTVRSFTARPELVGPNRNEYPLESWVLLGARRLNQLRADMRPPLLLYAHAL